MYQGPNGTTITAQRIMHTFTIRINDAEGRQIGAMENIVDIPRGLILAEGYVNGYYAGIIAGNKCMYRDICAVLGVTPDPKALAGFDRQSAEAGNR